MNQCADHMDALPTGFTTALAANHRTVPLLADPDIDTQRTSPFLPDDCGDQLTAPFHLTRGDIPLFEEPPARLYEFVGKALFYLLYGKGHLNYID
jgi:hypothetical protein